MRTLLTPFLILCLILPQSGYGDTDDHELKQRLRVSRMGHAWDRCGRMFSSIARSKRGIPILWSGIGVIGLVAGGYAYWAMHSERIMEDFEEGALPHEDDVDPDDFARMVSFANFNKERFTRTEEFLRRVTHRSDEFSEALQESFKLALQPSLMDAITYNWERAISVQHRIVYLFQFLSEPKDENLRFLFDVATNVLHTTSIQNSVRKAAMINLLKSGPDKSALLYYAEHFKKRHIDFSTWIDVFYLHLDHDAFWTFVDTYYFEHVLTIRTSSMKFYEQEALLKTIEKTKPNFEGAPEKTLRNFTNFMVEDYLIEQRSISSMFADVDKRRRMSAMLALVEKVGLSSGHLARLHSSTAAYRQELLQAHKSATEGK